MKLLILSDFTPSNRLCFSDEFKILLEEAQYILFNLEGSPNFSTIKNYKNQILKFDVEYLISFIKTYGGSKFIISLSNNHSLDNGIKAYKSFTKKLNENGIKYIGPKDKCSISLNSEVCIYSFSTITTGLSIKALTLLKSIIINEHKIIDEIDKLLEKHKIVIVYPHWGLDLDSSHQNPYKKLENYFNTHPNIIFLGHHPHLISGVKSSRKIFSLGNTYIPHPTYYERFPDSKYGLAILYDLNRPKTYLSKVLVQKSSDILCIKEIDISKLYINTQIISNKQLFRFRCNKFLNILLIIIIFFISSITGTYIYRKIRKRI